MSIERTRLCQQSFRDAHARSTALATGYNARHDSDDDVGPTLRAGDVASGENDRGMPPLSSVIGYCPLAVLVQFALLTRQRNFTTLGNAASRNNCWFGCDSFSTTGATTVFRLRFCLQRTFLIELYRRWHASNRRTSPSCSVSSQTFSTFSAHFFVAPILSSLAWRLFNIGQVCCRPVRAFPRSAC